MALKQIPGSLSAPDGSQYVTLTDGAGNLINNTTGSGGSTVSGDVASGSTDSGNPVKIGGLVRASGSAGPLTDGNRTDALFGSRGALEVQIMQANGTNPNSFVSTPTDGITNAFTGMLTGSMGFQYNGTTWDRVRGVNALGDATTLGLPSSGVFLYNGATWDRARSLGAGAGLQTSTTGLTPAISVPNNAAQCGIPSTATSAAASSLVLKASAGNLYSINVNSTAAGYVMLFDATSAPADGAVTPVYTFPVAANGGYSTDFEYPIRCNTGITLVYSSTGPFTKTASATAFMSGQFI